MSDTEEDDWDDAPEDEEEDAAFLSRIAESARGLNGCGGIHEVIAHLQVRGPVQLEYSNDPHRDDNRYRKAIRLRRGNGNNRKQ